MGKWNNVPEGVIKPWTEVAPKANRVAATTISVEPDQIQEVAEIQQQPSTTTEWTAPNWNSRFKIEL